MCPRSVAELRTGILSSPLDNHHTDHSLRGKLSFHLSFLQCFKIIHLNMESTPEYITAPLSEADSSSLLIRSADQMPLLIVVSITQQGYFLKISRHDLQWE